MGKSHWLYFEAGVFVTGVAFQSERRRQRSTPQNEGCCDDSCWPARALSGSECCRGPREAEDSPGAAQQPAACAAHGGGRARRFFAAWCGRAIDALSAPSQGIARGRDAGAVRRLKAHGRGLRPRRRGRGLRTRGRLAGGGGGWGGPRPPAAVRRGGELSSRRQQTLQARGVCGGSQAIQRGAGLGPTRPPPVVLPSRLSGLLAGLAEVLG